MNIPVLSIKGGEAGSTAELPDAFFNIEPNDHCIYLTVKQFHANQRQGTHKTLEKSEVNGSTRKLHKQKGTGGARAGSIKSPLFPGGARIFGPKPHDYGFKLNKKVKDLARKSALTYKARENKVAVKMAQRKQFCLKCGATHYSEICPFCDSDAQEEL
jgi:large subunit ribosomal protein L4